MRKNKGDVTYFLEKKVTITGLQKDKSQNKC